MLLSLSDLGNISRRKMRVISFPLGPGRREDMGASLPGSTHRRHSADEWHQKRVPLRAFHGFAAVRQLP